MSWALAASQLASGSSSVLGLLLRDPRNATYGLLHSELQRETSDAGLQLVTVVPAVEQRAAYEADALQRLLGLRVGGLFVATGVLGSEQLLPFVSTVPVVSVGRVERHPSIYAVSYDERAHGGMLVDAVVAYGHRRVGVLSPTRDVSLGEHARATAMVERLRAVGADVVEIEAVTFGVAGEGDGQIIDLVRARRITAVMFPSDQRALRFLEIADKAGVAVPDEVSVTGCDGVAVGLAHLGLQTLRVPVEAVAARAVQVMRDLIESPGSTAVRHEAHRGVLVAGATLSIPPRG